MSQSSEQFLQQREYEQGLLQETTRAEREQYVSGVIQKMEDGNIDPLKVHIQVKATEQLIKMLTDKKDNPATAERYGKLVLAAAELHGKKFELHNATFQIKEAGATYDYSQCNDPEIKALQALEKSVKADLKIREDFLKTVPAKGLEVLDKETGELITIYPPAKKSTTTLQTTLK